MFKLNCLCINKIIIYIIAKFNDMHKLLEALLDQNGKVIRSCNCIPN